VRWIGNLILSPIIYVGAGLLWNLEAKERRGFGDRSTCRLLFALPDWPSRPEDLSFGPVALPSIPLIVIAAFVLVAVVGWTVAKPRQPARATIVRRAMTTKWTCPDVRIDSFHS
jgi:hypothetical protein